MLIVTHSCFHPHFSKTFLGGITPQTIPLAITKQLAIWADFSHELSPHIVVCSSSFSSSRNHYHANWFDKSLALFYFFHLNFWTSEISTSWLVLKTTVKHNTLGRKTRFQVQYQPEKTICSLWTATHHFPPLLVRVSGGMSEKLLPGGARYLARLSSSW